MKPLISIIIPVYNLEKHIEKCVESLLAQTYGNIEIILVNDGSTDNSGAVCESLHKKDNRVVVIHQKNSGVSCARNNALDKMQGDYVTFVDGDDYVSSDFIEVLYNALASTGADISTCGHYRVSFDGKLTKIYNLSENPDDIITLDGKNSLKNMFYGKICSASSGSKLYSRKIFNNPRFPDYVMGEDTFFVYHAFSNASLIAHTNKAMYYYVQHEMSVTNNKSNYFKFYDYVRLYDHIISCDRNLGDRDYFLSLANRLIENNFWVYMKLRNCPDMFLIEKKHIEANIRKYRKYVVNNPLAEPRVRMACLLSYGGMNTLNLVYDKIMK